jgi:RNA polymerase sigma-70 factor (ECF subfamily)
VFASFFRAEYASLVRTVALVLRDSGPAEDIAQEAFVRLHLHWSKVSAYDRPDAWVRRVALNLAASHARREGRRTALERQSVSRSLATAVIDDAEPEAVGSGEHAHRALQDLPYKQRALVVLYYYEDRPLSEAGELLGLTPGSAKVTLHRARRRLQQSLADAGAVPAASTNNDGGWSDDV